MYGNRWKVARTWVQTGIPLVSVGVASGRIVIRRAIACAVASRRMERGDEEHGEKQEEERAGEKAR